MPRLRAWRAPAALADATLWKGPVAAAVTSLVLAGPVVAAPLDAPAAAEARSSDAPREGEWERERERERDAASSVPPVVTPLPLESTFRLFGGLSFGRGLRFNNPYRLETELGADERSLSVTAPYAALSLGAAGGRSALQHGAFVAGSFALEGVPQEVISPAYLVLYRPEPRWGLRGRGGLAIVVEPDLNAGFEAGFGGLLQLTGGIGVTADLVGSLFYGAATLDSSRAAIPVVSLEIGVAYEYEVLP